MWQVMGDTFIAHPLAALIPAAFFAGWGRLLRSPLSYGLAAMWGAYGIHELLMKGRLLCSGECNIRIDLLVLYPVLLLGSAAGILLPIIGRLRSRKVV
jgi:hypothetical protein